MNLSRLIRFLAGAAMLSSGLTFAAIPFLTGKKDTRGLQVLVTADAIPSPEGFRPKPGQPIHYLFHQTRETLGDAIGGVKLPAPEVVEQAVGAELAKQGYVRTDVGGPIPQIVIIAIVGDSNFEEPPIDLDNPLEDPDFGMYMRMVNVDSVLRDAGVYADPDVRGGLEGIFNRDSARSMALEKARDAIVSEAMRIRGRMSDRFRDRPRIQALVGAHKVLQGIDDRTLTNSEAERIAWKAAENTYYISLNAYDVERWRNKERVLLWRTTMLIDWRKDFAAELPTMLAHAGPVFGTDSAVPGFYDERTRATAEVSIGELKSVGDEKPAPAPRK